MGGINIVGIAAGLWHTLCITDIGDIYAFGGNQFGQLGVGGNTAEVTFLTSKIPSSLLPDEFLGFQISYIADSLLVPCTF